MLFCVSELFTERSKYYTNFQERPIGFSLRKNLFDKQK